VIAKTLRLSFAAQTKTDERSLPQIPVAAPAQSRFWHQPAGIGHRSWAISHRRRSFWRARRVCSCVILATDTDSKWFVNVRQIIFTLCAEDMWRRGVQKSVRSCRFRAAQLPNPQELGAGILRRLSSLLDLRKGCVQAPLKEKF
jgi:hypothetical protein